MGVQGLQAAVINVIGYTYDSPPMMTRSVCGGKYSMANYSTFSTDF